MSKQAAAGILALLFGIGLLAAWLGACLRTMAYPEGRLAKIMDVVTLVLASVMWLGIPSLVVYCIYVLIA